MKKHYLIALAMSAGLTFGAASLSASAKSASFDGTWNVRLVTEPAHVTAATAKLWLSRMVGCVRLRALPLFLVALALTEALS
jgi:hypothetical protein